MNVVLSVLLRLNSFGIGQQQRTFVNGGLLAAIEQLGGPQRVRIVATLKRIAQDQVAKLSQKDRRQIAGAIAGEVHVHGFERCSRYQPVAKRDHEGPILARIGVGESENVRL